MAGERHFACTACGKCCHGLLPLTLADALAHADRFPLGMLWTPVRQNQRSFELTARLGTRLRLRDRRTIAVRVTAVAYIPPALPCPALGADGRCTIHDRKPLRCRAMPFFPYVEEAEQAAHLVPRQGWDCDVSQAARVIFRDRNVIERADFDAERQQLLAQAPAIRAYADSQLAGVPGLAEKLGLVASRPLGGDVLLGTIGMLPHWPGADPVNFARSQRPVLSRFAQATADDPALTEFHHRYRQWEREMERSERHAIPATPAP